MCGGGPHDLSSLGLKPLSLQVNGFLHPLQLSVVQGQVAAFMQAEAETAYA
jgi:hypothetical protein